MGLGFRVVGGSSGRGQVAALLVLPRDTFRGERERETERERGAGETARILHTNFTESPYLKPENT